MQPTYAQGTGPSLVAFTPGDPPAPETYYLSVPYVDPPATYSCGPPPHRNRPRLAGWRNR